MKKINWKAVAALLIACAVGAAPLCAAAANRVISLTAGVFFLLAQDMVELSAGGGEEASVRTAEVSVDLLRLCSESSFGQKAQEDVEQLARIALEGMTPTERTMFMNTFEDRIVPFCDGLFAGDEACLNLLEDAGFAADLAWTEEDEGENGDQERWEILKEAVLSLAD